MKIPIKVEPANGGAAASVEYRWDRDTEILSAQLKQRPTGTGMSGSVEVEGVDGSWLILEVTAGRIHGVEIAVWPDVQKRSSLQPPRSVEDGNVIVSARKSQSEVKRADDQVKEDSRQRCDCNDHPRVKAPVRCGKVSLH